MRRNSGKTGGTFSCWMSPMAYRLVTTILYHYPSEHVCTSCGVILRVICFFSLVNLLWFLGNIYAAQSCDFYGGRQRAQDMLTWREKGDGTVARGEAVIPAVGAKLCDQSHEILYDPSGFYNFQYDPESPLGLMSKDTVGSIILWSHWFSWQTMPKHCIDQGCGVGIEAGVGVVRSWPFCRKSESELESVKFCLRRLRPGVAVYQPLTRNYFGLWPNGSVPARKHWKTGRKGGGSCNVEKRLKRHSLIEFRFIKGIGDDYGSSRSLCDCDNKFKDCHTESILMNRRWRPAASTAGANG